VSGEFFRSALHQIGLGTLTNIEQIGIGKQSWTRCRWVDWF